MSSIPLLSKVWNLFELWRVACHRRSHMRELLKFNDHILKDIGLCRVDAKREKNRPVWDGDARSDLRLREFPTKKD